MKKLIVISVLLAAVISLGAFEAAYTHAWFTDLADELTEIGAQVAEVEKDVPSPAAVARIDAVAERWEERRTVNYLFHNNNVLNNLFDRIVQARAYAAGGQNVDASTCLDGAAIYARSVAADIRPVPLNFL